MTSVLDIPDAALLGTNTLESLVDDFCNRLKIERPDVICLPLIDFGGANYQSSIVDQNAGPWARFDFLDLAREVSEYGSRLYVSINPTMNFLETSGLQTRTQYNREAPGVCITNPASQKLIRACIDEAIQLVKSNDLEIAGVVLDIVDINGQSADGSRIKLTCFCKYCTEALSRLGRFDYRIFKVHPNPINLFLRETPTGISNFNVDLRLTDPSDVIELSKDYRVFDHNLVATEYIEQWARIGLDYIEARSRVTSTAIQDIGRECRAKGIKFAAIPGFINFDFTTGTDAWHLTSKVVDEIWTDTGDMSKEEAPPGVQVFHYLSGRARYRIDAYFELVSDMSKLRAIAGGNTTAKGGLLDMIQGRGVTALTANQLSQGNANAVLFQDAFAGYVGVPLDDDKILRINDAIKLIIPKLVPQSTSRTQTSASEVVLLLMRLAQSGQPIDMHVLNQIATQLGLFGEPDE